MGRGIGEGDVDFVEEPGRRLSAIGGFVVSGPECGEGVEVFVHVLFFELLE